MRRLIWYLVAGAALFVLVLLVTVRKPDGEPWPFIPFIRAAVAW